MQFYVVMKQLFNKYIYPDLEHCYKIEAHHIEIH